MTGSFTCHCRNTGVGRHRIRVSRTKLTPQKKILPPLLPGFELAIFRSRVRRSTNKLSRLLIPFKTKAWCDYVSQTIPQRVSRKTVCLKKTYWAATNASRLSEAWVLSSAKLNSTDFILMKRFGFFFLFLFRLNSVEKLKIYVSRSRQGTHNNNNDNNNIMVVFKCLSLKALSALQDHEGGRGTR